MLYKIVNMSDDYTIEANSLETAFMACLVLGRGQYAFEPLKVGTPNIPLFLFGGADPWCVERFGVDLAAIIQRNLADETKRGELADCLDSCVIGNETDRTMFLAARDLTDDPAKRLAWRDQWHDARRSSMNDIGGRAYKIAAKLRAGEANPLVAAPQQVTKG